ncbi:MAG: VanZ family protein [Candidatus Woesearchaeota archaeon]
MKYALIALIYLVLVILASVIPNPISGESTNYFIHFLEFFILSSLVYLAAKHYKRKSPYLVAILASSFFAVLTEVLQGFISFRTFNPLDSLAGILGSLLILILKLKPKKGVWIKI